MRVFKLLLVTFFLLTIHLLYPQDASFMILNTSADDGIIYSDKGEDKQPVFSGTNLPAKGQLLLKEGTWVNVLFEGQKKRLTGPQVFNLPALAQKIKSENKSSFFSRFWVFLSNAVSRTNTNSNLEEYHQEFMNARAAVEGFGARKYEIGTPFYLSEVIGVDQLAFKWDSIATLKGTYTFSIQSREEVPILKATTLNNQLTLDLSELHLNQGEVYEWKVTAIKPDSTYAYSASMPFSYEPETVDAFIAKVKRHDNYQDFEDQEQQLFVLHELGRQSFRYDAYHYYTELLRENPDNLLIKKLFAAFLAENNALEEAKSVLKY